MSKFPRSSRFATRVDADGVRCLSFPLPPPSFRRICSIRSPIPISEQGSLDTAMSSIRALGLSVFLPDCICFNVVLCRIGLGFARAFSLTQHCLSFFSLRVFCTVGCAPFHQLFKACIEKTMFKFQQPRESHRHARVRDGGPSAQRRQPLSAVPTICAHRKTSTSGNMAATHGV